MKCGRAKYNLSNNYFTVDIDVAHEEGILEAEQEYWVPILDYGRRRLEIAPHLDNSRIVRWFLAAHLFFVERPEIFVPNDIQSWIEDFIVPPVLS